MTNDRDASPLGASESDSPLIALLGGPPAGPADRQLMQRAGEFIEHLREQLAELDRREQNVNAQYLALDQDRRRFRLSMQQLEDELHRREQELARREADVTAVQTERETLRRLREEVDSERQELQREKEALAAERARMEQTITEQLAHERSSLAAQQDALKRLQLEHEEQRRLAFARLEQELEEERQTRLNDLEQSLAALDAEILEKRQWWDEEQARVKEQFEADRQEREQQLAALTDELEQRQRRTLEEIEHRQQELHRQSIDLEKRTRFHEAHLDQVRRTLEQRQHELDAQHQKRRAKQVETDRQLQRRAAQLQRFRELLDYREDSLERERSLLDDARRSFEDLRAAEQKRQQIEHENWEKESEAQKRDMKRQREILALHAANLESRRQRLDRLRDELESAHRETLEMRLAVEQTWSQLAQQFGESASRHRIEQARTALVSHFEDVRAAIDQRRTELDEVHNRLQRQRDEFHAERQQFAAWLTQRDEELRTRELALREEVDAASAREAQWIATRDRWLQEKLKAETVIRELLSELEVKLAADSPFDPPVSPGAASVRESSRSPAAAVLEDDPNSGEVSSPAAA